MLKKWQLRIKLRLKIFLIVLPLITIPLVLVGSLCYVYLRENSLHILENQMELALTSSGDEITQKFDQARANLKLLADNHVIRRYMALPKSTRYRIMQPAILETLKGFQSVFDQYLEISIYTPDGKLDTEVRINEHNLPNITEFHKKLVTERPRYAEQLFFHDGEHSHVDLVLARRIFATDDRASAIRGETAHHGYLVMLVRYRGFKERMDEALTSQEGVLALTNATGIPHLATSGMSNGTQSLLTKVVASGIGKLRTIYSDDSQYLGGFKRIGDNLLLVGVVTHQTIDRVVNPIVSVISWAVILVSLLSFLLIYSRLNHVLIAPLAQLRHQVAAFKHTRRLTSIRFKQDELGELASVFRELAENLVENEKRVKELSHFDPLTGLPNRQAFNLMVEKALSLADRLDQVLAVLYIDINNYREINDIYGLEIGDMLVREAALRLQSCLRISDEVSRQVISEPPSSERMLGRSGGDEFAVILRDIHQAHQASVVSQRIISSFDQPFYIEGNKIYVSISIGIALYPVDGLSTDMLLKSADLALYDAKQIPGSAYRFFTHALNSSSEKRLLIENELRAGVQKGQFKLFLQPKVSLRSGLASDFEATLRWQHPKAGLLYPEQFMSVAEESGQILALELFALEEACKAIVRLRNSVENPKVSIDFSAQQVLELDMLNIVDQYVEKFGIKPNELEFEFSELILEGKQIPAELTQIFKALRRRGVSLVLNDFGKGAASLTLLRRYPFVNLKVAKEFMKELAYDGNGNAITEVLFNFAHSVNLGVILDGVDVESSLEMAKLMEVDFVQGAFLQSPVMPEKVRYDFRDVIFKSSDQSLVTQ